jgi:hypothetical protein
LVNKLEDFMFSCLLNKVFLFFNKFKPLAGQVNFFSCGFVLWVSGTFFSENLKTSQIDLQSKKKPRNSNTSVQFPQSIIDQTTETSLKEKTTRCS